MTHTFLKLKMEGLTILSLRSAWIREILRRELPGMQLCRPGLPREPAPLAARGVWLGGVLPLFTHPAVRTQRRKRNGLRSIANSMQCAKCIIYSRSKMWASGRVVAHSRAARGLMSRGAAGARSLAGDDCTCTPSVAPQ